MKAIHVKLTNARQEIVVFEVPRKDLGCQPRNIFDNEGITFSIPANDVFVLGVLSQEMFTSTMR